MSLSKLKEYIREIIKDELEEASTSANVPGYQTPFAFSDPKKDKKKKKKRDLGSTGYNYVSEEITSAGYSEIGKRGRYLPLATKEFIKALKKQDDREVIKNIEYIADLMDFMKDTLKNKKYNESINEGKYHDYRNDETLTPKQKIGKSMREIRDSLNNLDKVVKMNVRLKNELNVDSRSYWKNTHKALNKISERLVKLANKVGQLK
tara:strand:+ start:1933 stop:2550 length:618 start_codon:yes stop_codon:yes gene_type:complete